MNAVARIARRWNEPAVDAVVIGGGQSGLAISHFLAESGVEHVVLERGEVANSWRHERWDSLRLLTPNWQTSLPGLAYDGNDPDGFMTCEEVVAFIDRFAADTTPPLRAHTRVSAVQPLEHGYRVVTDQGIWRTGVVVLASGAFGVPNVPRALAAALPRSIATCTSKDYRNPDQLEDGGVLVVGASASGLQIADEIQRSGHPVTLAVGEHVRMLRNYRGRDIQWWMHAAGILDQDYRAVDDIVRARHVPSPQLVGSTEHRTLDLNALRRSGARIVGRLAGINGARAQFGGSLHNLCTMADLKLARLLDTFDAWAAATGLDAELPEPTRPAATSVDADPCLTLDLAQENIRSCIWATGFRPDYSYVELPVFDRRGMIEHDGGVLRAPGIYVMGLPFLRRRKSTYIHGAEDDARELSAHALAYLRGRALPSQVTPQRHSIGALSVGN
jgi:putative flavoprotein involved in K+ transport